MGPTVFLPSSEGSGSLQRKGFLEAGVFSSEAVREPRWWAFSFPKQWVHREWMVLLQTQIMTLGSGRSR